MIIALMGNDGSGKTTIAKELSKIFEDLGFEVVYKHEYQYNLLKFLFKIVGIVRIESERKKMIIERRKSWKYYLWPYLVWVDTLFAYLYFKLLRSRAIVILDRYLLDHFISFKYLAHSTKLSEWLYMHCPKPDVNVVLWVEPKIAYLRKKKTHRYDVTFYTEQVKNYLELAENLGIEAINTNTSVGKSIYEILKVTMKHQSDLILKRGIQNKVLFSVMEKYRIKSLFPALTKALQNRKERLKRTLYFIKDFFQKNDVRRYAIVKTLHSNTWIGNDVDVLISKAEFKKMMDSLKELSPQHITLNWRFSEKGKVDVALSNSLPLDLHSYIGWRNVVFISSDDILKEEHIVKRRNGLYFTTKKIDSVIIALTHLFGKGYITLDEADFLKKHLDMKFAETNFPYLYVLIHNYVCWIKDTLEKKHHYPMFIPISIITKSYLGLLFHSSNGNCHVLWKSIALARDISYMIFFRARYIAKNKLPFEVNMIA